MLVSKRNKVLTALLVLCSGLGAPAVLAEELYLINTTCSTPISPNVSCQVQAIDVDDSTEYHHRFGSRTVSYRVMEDPYVRIEGRASNSAPWGSNASSARRPLAIGRGQPLFPLLAAGWMEALAGLPIELTAA